MWKVMSFNRSGKSKAYANIENPDNKKERLIAFDTIPLDKQLLFNQTYCGGISALEYFKQQQAKAETKENQLLQSTLVEAARKLININELTDLQKSFGESKGYQYAFLAAWYRLISSVRGAKDARQYGYGNKSDLLVGCLKQISSAITVVSISNTHYLNVKANDFIKNGIERLVSKKHSNNNAAKVGDVQLATLISLYSDPRKFTPSQITLQYWSIARENNWPLITERRIRQILEMPTVMNTVAKNRYGKKYVHDKIKMVINRTPASHPDALWIADGTPTELFYYDNGKMGRLYQFTVLDAYSWKVIGLAISETEGSDGVYRAFKMAATSSGRLPHQILTDNGSGIVNATTKEFLNRIAKYNIQTEVGNARSKKIEPFYAHYNRAILKYYDNHSGGNITARKIDTHTNPDFIKANYKSFPNKENLLISIEESIALWNASAGAELAPDSNRPMPNAAYAIEYANKIELTFDLQVSLFWQWRMRGYGNNARKLTYTYTFEGLVIEFNGDRIRYVAPGSGTASEIADFFHNHLHDKFYVKFDRENPEMIAIYDQHDKFVAYADKKTLIPEAFVDYKEGDRKNLDKYRLVQREQERIADEELNENYALVEANSVMQGGITKGRMFKNAMNDAEAALKLEWNLASRYPKPKQTTTGGDLYRSQDPEGGEME